jgi:predicted ATPase
MMFLAEMTESLVARQSPEGLARMEGAIDLAERTAEGWIMPELLRIKGELLLLDGAPAEEAESCFEQALDLSATQGALSWELRAATSLATLYRGQGRAADAIASLRPIYDRFTEGFDTADLLAAKALLDTLR